MKYHIALLGLAVLLGVGCASSTPAPTNTNTTPAPTPSPSEPTTPSTPSDPSTPTASTPATSTSEVIFTVDDTWKTYTNNALKFSFQWPTKGRYAPQWNVAFIKEDPCSYDTSAIKKEIAGISFCHQSNVTKYHDVFVTRKGEQYIKIEFTKDNINPNVEFNSADYYKMLETIISTFKYQE